MTAPLAARRGLVVGATCVLVLVGCGYSPVLSAKPEQSLSVVVAPSKAPGSAVLTELVQGVREELRRSGSLRGGDDYPRLVVELLRIDTSPIAVRANSGLASSARVGVVARARVFERAGVPASRDTQDMRRVETFAVGNTPARDATRRDQALQVAARRLGNALVRRALGAPEPRRELQ